MGLIILVFLAGTAGYRGNFGEDFGVVLLETRSGLA